MGGDRDYEKGMRKGKGKRKSAWLGFVFATGRVWLLVFRGGGAGVEPGRPVQKYFVSSVAYAQPLGAQRSQAGSSRGGKMLPTAAAMEASTALMSEDSKV